MTQWYNENGFRDYKSYYRNRHSILLLMTVPGAQDSFDIYLAVYEIYILTSLGICVLMNLPRFSVTIWDLNADNLSNACSLII